MANREVVDTFVKTWLESFKKSDKGTMLALLSPTMTFYSPVTHKPYTDRRFIDQVLRWILEIVENFTYRSAYTDPENLGVVLLFSGKHKNVEVEGADFIRLNPEGKVVELKVMLRPLKATMTVGEEMKKRFQALTSFGTPLDVQQQPVLPPSSKL